MQAKPMELDMSRLHGRHEEPPADKPLADEPVKPLAELLTTLQVEDLRLAVVNELHQCFDPEIPVNIHELGLIYSLDVQPNGNVHINMTLTSPACPVAGSLPGEVKARLRKLPNVTAVTIDVVWEPPWDKSRMSEAAKLQLGIDD